MPPKALVLGLFLLFGTSAISVAAFAQQAPDPRLTVYQQLLTEANDRVVGALSQVQTLTKELADTKAELAKIKSPEVPPKKP